MPTQKEKLEIMRITGRVSLRGRPLGTPVKNSGVPEVYRQHAILTKAAYKKLTEMESPDCYSRRVSTFIEEYLEKATPIKSKRIQRTPQGDTHQTTFTLPLEMQDKLKLFSYKTKKTISLIITEAIERGI